MDLAADILSWVFILAGAFFLLAGGIGLVRLPDLYTRLHPAGVIDTVGVAFTLIGFMIQAGFTFATVKLILILAFIFFTSPTATHALAKAAGHGGLRPRLDGEDAPSRS